MLVCSEYVRCKGLWNIKPGIVSLFFILAGLMFGFYASTEQISYEEMTSTTITAPVRTSIGQRAFVSVRQYSYETHTVTFAEYPYRDFGAILIFIGVIAELGLYMRSRRKKKEKEIGIY